MNNVNLIGRIATDVKIGNGVVSSLLAVHRIYHSHDGVDTDFIPLSIFGKQATNFQKMVSKGEMVGIDGRIKTSEYADENGEKRYGWCVVVNHFYLSGEHHEGQQKLSQDMISSEMHSPAQHQQQDLYDQYHQQTAKTPRAKVDKQLDDLDKVLNHAQIQHKPMKVLKQDDPRLIAHFDDKDEDKDKDNNNAHVSGSDFSQEVKAAQPSVEELEREIKELKAKALPF